MFTTRCCIHMHILTMSTIGIGIHSAGTATSPTVMSMSTAGCATGMHISPISIIATGTATAERRELL